MLHLIFQSPVNIAVLERIECADEVVFLNNAVFQMIKGSSLTEELQRMLENNIDLNMLAEDMESRGIKQKELIHGVQIVNYSGLVKLTEKNKHIRTWN